MTLRAVILDWAGTIVDFGSRAPVAAFMELFRRRGVVVTAAEARAPMGQNKKEHVRAVAAMERVAAAWRAAHGRDVVPGDIDSMYAEFVPIQRRVLQAHATPIPGVREALAAFRARGLAIGTTTGYSRDLMEVVETHAGLEVDCVITSSDVTAGRPAPWMALAAAAQLGVYPMRAIVKIGDTLADIDEGRNAGMWSVGVTRTGNELGLSEEEERALPAEERAERLAAARERMLAAGAHATVESVADAHSVLDDIEARLARDERP